MIRLSFLKRFLLSAFLLFLLIGQASYTLGQRVPRKIPIPKNIEASEISLITVGLGPAVYMRYGHTLLKFLDKESGRSYLYNWGMFSFDDPMFPFKFFLGERKYWVGETSERFVVKLYRDYEDRNVYEQKINLTSKQKLRLIELVNQNLNVDSMFFNYEHFTSNCATKPRDFLDGALGGYITRELKDEFIEGLTYRDYVRENMNMPPFLGFILDIAMSSDLEKNLSKWDETFYPPKLSEHLAGLNQIDDEGNRIENTRLLGRPIQLVKASSEHFSSKFQFIKPFSGFFGLILFILWLGLVKKGRSILEAPSFRYLFGTFSILWGFFAGLMGLFMTLSWAVSTHFDMHHNVNLLVFFVTDFMLIGLGIKSLKKRSLILPPAHRYLNKIHLLCLLIFTLGFVFGLFDQDVSRVFYYLMPIQLLFCIWVEILGSKKNR